DLFYIIIQRYFPLTYFPLKSFFQIVKVILSFISFVIIIALIFNKSPVILLSGLGAMAALLALIFKEPLQGIIASIQLSLNGMASRGDWIEAEKYHANGIITDISLLTVKVRNWNNTISMLPAWGLISESFINHGHIHKSSNKRVSFTLWIAPESLCYMTTEECESLMSVERVRDVLNTSPLAGENNLNIFCLFLQKYLSNDKYSSGNVMVQVKQRQDICHAIAVDVSLYIIEKCNYEAISI
ncbi:mechanosensitive ion channel family protein, partial [Citrobacter portucalensis]|uniref:mechanosensitive ion channel domain-containing protein n=1 Tax=Citrobacter portucalensis TaxID=1639133 RepID=UPI00226B7B76